MKLQHKHQNTYGETFLCMDYRISRNYRTDKSAILVQAIFHHLLFITVTSGVQVSGYGKWKKYSTRRHGSFIGLWYHWWWWWWWWWWYLLLYMRTWNWLLNNVREQKRRENWEICFVICFTCNVICEKLKQLTYRCFFASPRDEYAMASRTFLSAPCKLDSVVRRIPCIILYYLQQTW
jgi:hypothetical protein